MQDVNEKSAEEKTDGRAEEKKERGAGKRAIAARELAYAALGVALVAVCAQITVPMSVPFTMQTFAVFFLVAVLGEKVAFISLLSYILLGLVGVPVFSSFGAGPAALFGMTGGYIVGFLFIPPVSFIFGKLGGKHRMIMTAAGFVVGLLVTYAFGTAWFMVAYGKNVGKIALGAALLKCVVPFIVPDLIKLSLALLLGARLKKYIKL